MRIAYDGRPLLGHRFGIGHYTFELIRAVARARPDVRCTVVGPWPVNPLRRLTPPVFEEPNVDVPVRGFLARLTRRLLEKTGVRVPLETFIGPVDVFHGTNYLLTHAVRRAARVVTIHDLTVIRSPQWHPAARLRAMVAGLRASAEAADRIITLSQASKDDIVEHLGVDPGRVAIVPLGVSPSFRPLGPAETEPLLRPLGLVHGSYLLFLGTIEPRKNLRRLVDAATTLGDGVGPLVLAGADGWGEEDLRPRLADLARRGRIRRLGYVPEGLRAPLLSGARVFVYPSLFEGFGWPPLEAMACGTPVVTSNVSALPEVVADAALLVDPLDVEALAGAMRRLWDDEALRASLSARGLARARRFTWEETARLTLAAYAAAMGS